MKVATLGMVSALSEYIDKKTGLIVRKASVAAGDQMLQVTVPDGVVLAEYDSVMLSGELKMFERRFYMEAARIRLSTAEDRLFLSNVAIPTPPDPAALSVTSLQEVAQGSVTGDEDK